MKNMIVSIAIMTFFFCLPKSNFGQTPNLLSLNRFALFTSIGEFNNSGASQITGDAGTNSGAFALNSGSISGFTHVEDSISAIAKSDVDSIYLYFNSIPNDTIIGSTLGNGQILNPKTFYLDSFSALDGELILDGQGDPNSIFIFKINGALSTSISSKVVLINSATFKNIYWQINGAVVLGDSSVFNGNIIAAGAITLLEGANLTGRGLSTAGAILLNNNVVKMELPPLPIELLSFKVSPSGFNFLLNWSTASETNNDFFTVLRSKNGISFEEINQVNGAGNSNQILYYSATDNAPLEGPFYYQLKQTDYDGKYSLSKIVSVNNNKSIEISVYPNPFSSSINILIRDEDEFDNCYMKIYNTMGIEVMNTKINTELTNIETSVLPIGTYFYKVIDNKTMIQSGKLVSQK